MLHVARSRLRSRPVGGCAWAGAARHPGRPREHWTRHPQALAARHRRQAGRHRLADSPAPTRASPRTSPTRASRRERTEVRVLFDDTALYIGVRCFDRRPGRDCRTVDPPRPRHRRRQSHHRDLSSKNDHMTAYHFDLNVSGVHLDGVRFNDAESPTIGTACGSAPPARPRGWSAELGSRSRPCATRAGDPVRLPGPAQPAAPREVDEWAYVPRIARGEVSHYGVSTGLKWARAARLFQSCPTSRRHLPAYAQDRRDLTVRASRAGSVATSSSAHPALTLDVTINPDFGQVEADQVVLNLTDLRGLLPGEAPLLPRGRRAVRHAVSALLFAPDRPPRRRVLPTTSPSRRCPGQIWLAAKLTGLLRRA